MMTKVGMEHYFFTIKNMKVLRKSLSFFKSIEYREKTASLLEGRSLKCLKFEVLKV